MLLTARRLLKRLSVDTINTMGRSLAKLSLQDPNSLSEIILDNICAYENFIEPVLGILIFWHPYALDILLWRALKLLSQTGKFMNLSIFLGALLSRFSTTLSIEAYLSTLLRIMLAGRSDTMSCLAYLLSRISGLEALEEWTEHQVLIKACADPIFFSVFSSTSLFTQTHSDFSRLTAALASTGYLAVFWVGIPRLVSQNTPILDQEFGCFKFSKNIKTSGQLLDSQRRLFLQYTDVLRLSGIKHLSVPDIIKNQSHILPYSQTDDSVHSIENTVIYRTLQDGAVDETSLASLFWSSPSWSLVEASDISANFHLPPDISIYDTNLYKAKLRKFPIPDEHFIFTHLWKRAVFSPVDAIFCANFLCIFITKVECDASMPAEINIETVVSTESHLVIEDSKRLLSAVLALPCNILPSLTQSESAELGIFLDTLLLALMSKLNWKQAIFNLFIFVMEDLLNTTTQKHEMAYIRRRNLLYMLSKMTRSFPRGRNEEKILATYLQSSIQLESSNDLKLVMRRYLHMLLQKEENQGTSDCDAQFSSKLAEIQQRVDYLAIETESQAMQVEDDDTFRREGVLESVPGTSSRDELNKLLLEEMQKEQQELKLHREAKQASKDDRKIHENQTPLASSTDAADAIEPSVLTAAFTQDLQCDSAKVTSEDKSLKASSIVAIAKSREALKGNSDQDTCKSSNNLDLSEQVTKRLKLDDIRDKALRHRQESELVGRIEGDHSQNSRHLSQRRLLHSEEIARRGDILDRHDTKQHVLSEDDSRYKGIFKHDNNKQKLQSLDERNYRARPVESFSVESKMPAREGQPGRQVSAKEINISQQDGLRSQDLVKIKEPLRTQEPARPQSRTDNHLQGDQMRAILRGKTDPLLRPPDYNNPRQNVAPKDRLDASRILKEDESRRPVEESRRSAEDERRLDYHQKRQDATRRLVDLERERLRQDDRRLLDDERRLIERQIPTEAAQRRQERTFFDALYHDDALSSFRRRPLPPPSRGRSPSIPPPPAVRSRNTSPRSRRRM
jgi:hypothetical protein